MAILQELRRYLPVEWRSEVIEEQKAYGLVPTLNRHGYMKEDLCYYSESFVTYSHTSPYPVLEIGAAYGVASLAALKTGAVVISNDLDERHLEILRKNIPFPFVKNSILIPGKFPDDLRFSNNSIGAILASRVFNYLTGAEIESALLLCYFFEGYKPNTTNIVGAILIIIGGLLFRKFSLN